MQPMTKDHPLWDEFCERLDGPDGCDFHEKIPGDPESITWKCAGDKDKSLAISILKEMGNIDIPASVAYFEEHGCYCDCEIVFNLTSDAKDKLNEVGKILSSYTGQNLIAVTKRVMQATGFNPNEARDLVKNYITSKEHHIQGLNN